MLCLASEILRPWRAQRKKRRVGHSLSSISACNVSIRAGCFAASAALASLVRARLTIGDDAFKHRGRPSKRLPHVMARRVT
jgi:hypothetical protein